VKPNRTHGHVTACNTVGQSLADSDAPSGQVNEVGPSLAFREGRCFYDVFYVKQRSFNPPYNTISQEAFDNCLEEKFQKLDVEIRPDGTQK
jgi:hypothetical protein